jgi:hypothetical protein
MNITAGSSTQKQHLSNGSRTACNIRTSGIGNNDRNSFKFWAEKYPEECCKRCLIRYNHK